jgi:16S rRNA processing protein RimM
VVSPLLPGSDEVLAPSEPAFLAVGRVLRPHGLGGEVKVEIHTDYPERFALHKRLYLGPEHVPFVLQSHRFHGGAVLLKLEGIDTRTEAEALREQWVWLPIEEAVPLEEGECYLYQMMHLRVVTVDGEELGEIVEVIETGANDVYLVRDPAGDILLPDIDQVVIHLDLDAKQMTVRLLDGLR